MKRKKEHDMQEDKEEKGRERHAELQMRLRANNALRSILT